MITFGGGTGTVGGDLAHTPAVATECHQPGDDGRFAVAHAAQHDGAAVLCGLAGLKDVLQLLEEPITAHKHGVRGDAGYLEQQRFEHDVHGLVGSKTSWGEEMKQIIINKGKYYTIIFHMNNDSYWLEKDTFPSALLE